MATMKSVRNEMLRQEWQGIVKRHTQRGLTVRKYFKLNAVTLFFQHKFY